MASLNRVQLIGNIGQKPELRKTKAEDGTPVTSFSLATNFQVKGDEGKTEDRTDWHRVVVWGRTAEVCAQYLDKGSLVYVEGRLQVREYKDKEGKDQLAVEVVANDVQFLDRKKSGAPSAAVEG